MYILKSVMIFELWHRSPLSTRSHLYIKVLMIANLNNGSDELHNFNDVILIIISVCNIIYFSYLYY